jgi:hypothetical protein
MINTSCLTCPLLLTFTTVSIFLTGRSLKETTITKTTNGLRASGQGFDLLGDGRHVKGKAKNVNAESECFSLDHPMSTHLYSLFEFLSQVEVPEFLRDLNPLKQPVNCVMPSPLTPTPVVTPILHGHMVGPLGNGMSPRSKILAPFLPAPCLMSRLGTGTCRVRRQ